MSKWISVTEKLPEDGLRVLGCFKGQFACIQFVASNVGGRVFAHGYANATHWMYLPKPPKEMEASL